MNRPRMPPLPRLRPLEIFPTDVDGQRLLCLRDPSGMTDRLAFVPPAAAALLMLCDGRRDAPEVARELLARTGMRISEAQIESVIEQLDDGLFLDSPRFRAHRRAVVEEFRSSARRAPVHAGNSYPGDAGDLARHLGGLTGPVDKKGGPLPAAVIAPHIDFPRGGAVYGRAYRPILLSGERPDLVIVFGTDHNGVDHPFTLTRKSYDTPLGLLETDVDLVDALVRETGDEQRLFADEIHHRTEHSIEFQAVWLRHAFGDAPPPVLPILCGSLHRAVERGGSPRDEREVRGFLETLARLTAGRRVLVVAGADLAHVGPRFGDEPWGDDEKRVLAGIDEKSLAACARGDAEAFFSSVAVEKDRHRVCGLSPIYATLAHVALRGGGARGGEVLGYAQCPADEEGASWVSIGAVLIC
jgi:MEMO1 family protein